MNKRKASDDIVPAGVRLKHDVDAMGCLIMAVTRDNKAQRVEIDELKETNQYLHRQVERLDKYTEELEGRLAAMEAVIANLLNGGHHWTVESTITEIRETQQYDMTDLDRLLAEYETEEEPDWFDELFQP